MKFGSILTVSLVGFGLVYILGNQSPPRTYPTSSATFEEVHGAIGCGAGGTEAQKEAIFAQNYKNHWVTWEGTIFDVRDRIEVKVDAATSNFDVYPSSSQSLVTLSPGSRVKVNFILREAEGCLLPFYGDNAIVETLQSASEIAAAKKQEADAQLAYSIRACRITREAVRNVDTSVDGIDLATSGVKHFTDSLEMEEAERNLKEAKFSGDPTRIAGARARFDEVQASEAASSRDEKCKSALIEAHNRAIKGDWSLVPTSPKSTVSMPTTAPVVLVDRPEANSKSRAAPLSPELYQTFRNMVLRSGRSCEAITDQVWVNPVHVSLMCDRQLRVAFIQGPKGWRVARPGE